METKVESLSPVKKKLSFEVPADRVALEIDKAYEKIRGQVAIKGFRKGKAPQALIEKYYAAKMEEDVLNRLFNDTYFKAITEEKIAPVAHPVVEGEDLKRGEPFRYTAIVEVFPEVVVKDFAGLEVKKERFVKDASVIEKRLEEMRGGMAQLQPLTEPRSVEEGDFVTIDFKGAVGGVPFAGGEATDYVLEIGSGRFIPGFEEQLVGMTTGSTKDIAVTFPESYGNEDLAGKEATFEVKLSEIKVKELPPLDDEFAKQFGEFETLSALMSKLEELHEKQERDRIDADVRERIVRALIDKNGFELPDALVDRQLQVMLENTKKRLSYQNLSLEKVGLDEEGYKQQFRGVAESQVRGSLLLEALADQQGLKVEDAEFEAKVGQFAQESGQPLERVMEYYRQNRQASEGLYAQLKEDKAMEFLLSQAVVTEVDKAEI